MLHKIMYYCHAVYDAFVFVIYTICKKCNLTFISKILIISFLCASFVKNNASVAGVTHPVAIDSRIKTLVYSPNEIFSLKFMVGYQSILEFEQDEEIELIAFGDPLPWSIKVVGTRIFIKALDPDVKTNMTILTNKRVYLMEIASSEFADEGLDEDLVYVAKFFYPEVDVDAPKKFSIRAPNLSLPLSPTGENTGIDDKGGSVNYRYTFSGTGTSILPIKIFDDNKRTYMQFSDNNTVVPGIYSVDEKGREKRLKVYLQDEYVVIDSIEYQFSLRWGDDLICIFNEELLRSIENDVIYNR